MNDRFRVVSPHLLKSNKAAALAYDPSSNAAPRLIGKGGGPIADRILQLAQAKGIPIHQDTGLVNFLMRIDIDQQIPSELYSAVAAILAMLWASGQQTSNRSSAQAPPK
jgi:flagellar biosynthesis protein